MVDESKSWQSRVRTGSVSSLPAQSPTTVELRADFTHDFRSVRRQNGATRRGMRNCSIGETPLRTIENEEEDEEEGRCNLRDAINHISALDLKKKCLR
ncbi:hypothetical protein CDL15_Pgr018685 [Punica granatum]|uniref:Uncharacterized protein n=1 Tax=Punica granatum TaxID=22663 RepID=A0A218VU86_PUNGR|nr:hypothetical protein CDL15_Pgr018685 [Punica granatum]PKI57159.1 hypothetical protein CRG98_022449 [Punica granatum]